MAAESRASDERERSPEAIRAAAPAALSESPELIDAMVQTWDAARRSVRHSLALLSAESELAARSAAAILPLTLVLGCLLLSVWLTLVLAVVYLAVAAGVPLPAAALAAALAQLVAAVMVWRGIGRLLNNLTLPHTRAGWRKAVGEAAE